MNGAALKALREAKGWPAAKFATAVGMSAPYLCNVEAGRKARLSPDKVRRAADVLQVPLAAITSPEWTEDAA